MRFRCFVLFCCGFILLATSTQAMANPVTEQLRDASTLEKVIKNGKLRIGFSTFVPWAMKDKTGAFIGYEIDVATRLAHDMGVRPEFIPTKWSGIIPSLLTGKFDIIIGGMGITPKRNLKVNFTIPYEYSGMSMIANKKLAAGFNSLEDFNKPSVTLSARTGATPVQAAKRFMPRATLRFFDDEAQALQEVLIGKAHAMIASAPFPAHQAIRHENKLFLPLGETTFTKEPIGFAIKKGDPDFLNFLNNWIIITSAEGWLQARHDYWFKTLDWEQRIK
ncbi:transporter substrate-binding domain-containing protein [Desulfoplanes formicivorans]|uniref:Amino acid ABC transporter substrate-binding protein n=1 Tax=Desulfoplanes formicivorans TaxID=1592317 RepID=A0A194AF57_9BACT|nr:transporter substrate-binding domain-containing protein [Desulfoplanes formicivorans]GAU07830.1 amino acid ABC transporter substrate-binding protein [Desulfoplanes formicivorans]